MNERICPKCGAANVHLRPFATRACGGIGALSGLATAAKAGTAGAALGSVIMPVIGTAIGGVTGTVAGFFVGALSGASIGHAIDRKIIQAYHCDSCGHNFAA